MFKDRLRFVLRYRANYFIGYEASEEEEPETISNITSNYDHRP